ncbi:hypothetical protein Q8W71_21305 [Methylobacterium sp. NEAU 140]|uniref:hypothetical protein n=1 Tax=Methylobacterium sp. NEAU 140 TaxID=3064945 RepID=UPI00273293F0|nr:hypothetical protein [Methylobacterium sp. NEAU 140]MDP4025173.1 hypothetical protein [Methylobacterium sp. NEAU 140]
MPKVRIIGPIDGEMREALTRLLGDAGCEILDDSTPESVKEDVEQDHVGDDIEEIEEAKPLSVEAECSAEAVPERDEDAAIIVLTPECLADGNLEKTMQGAAARGCHVVGVWPPETVDQDLPRPFEDYGGDTVIWDLGKIRDVVSRPDTRPTWCLPDDQPRTERQLKRNKC